MGVSAGWIYLTVSDPSCSVIGMSNTEITTTTHEVLAGDPAGRFGITETVVTYSARVEGVATDIAWSCTDSGTAVTVGRPTIAVHVNLDEGTSDVWTGRGSIHVTQVIPEDAARLIVRRMVEAFAQWGWDEQDWRTPVQWAMDFIQVFVFDPQGRNLRVGYYPDGRTDVYGIGPLGDFLFEYEEACRGVEDQLDYWEDYEPV